MDCNHTNTLITFLKEMIQYLLENIVFDLIILESVSDL